MILDIVFQSQSGEFYNQTTKGFFDYLIPAITAAASLAALTIAILVYRNKDVNKHYAKSQFEEVFKLAQIIEEIKIRIMVFKDDGTGTGNLGSELIISEMVYLKIMMDVLKKSKSDLKNKPIYFKTHILPDFRKFTCYATNIFIPPEIKKQLRKFEEVNSANTYPAYNDKEFFLILMDDGNPTMADSLDTSKFFRYKGEVYDSLITFTDELLHLRSLVKKRLKKWGVMDYDFPV